MLIKLAYLCSRWEQQSTGNSENHIHDEYHRRLEPAVPADHQEQAVVHQR